MRVAVREAIVGRDALIAEAGLLELERLGCEAELQVRRAVEVGPEIVEVLLEVPEREPTRARLYRSLSSSLGPAGSPTESRRARV